MVKDNRTLLGNSPIRSHYTRLLAQSCFPQLAEILPQLESFTFDSVKVTDFSMHPGSASCRVITADGDNVGVRLRAETLADEHWDSLIELLSQKAFFAAQLLAGRLPTEIAELAKSNCIPLIPEELVAIEQDTVIMSELTIPVAALLIRISEALEEDPCQFLLFRGRTSQEVIAELRKQRLTQTAERRRPTAITELAYPSDSQAAANICDFWSMSPEIKELQYTIKADELPASILKWLAPIPLSGLEDRIDFMVEEGYARITRLAQSFGLGL